MAKVIKSEAKTVKSEAKKADTKAASVPAKPFQIKDEAVKQKLIAKVKKAKLVVELGEEGQKQVDMRPVVSADLEGPVYDVLNGRIGSRTQVIHSILIDAAKRDVLLTTQAIQTALESYLGKGHGAAYAHLNTLKGRGDNMAHPCKQTPYVVHDEETGYAWGLSLVACQLAGLPKTELPHWVKLPKGGKYTPAKVKTGSIIKASE